MTSNTDHDGDFNHGLSGGFHEYQVSCLAMSLASGLEALEGLKKLKVVSCMRMLMDIRVEEVQWMVKAWPRLEFVGGLNMEIQGVVAGQLSAYRVCSYVPCVVFFASSL